MQIGEIISKYRKSRNMTQEDLRKNLLQCFRDEATYGFLSGDERWREIVKEWQNFE